MDLKGSKTEQNLYEAIKGECFATNKYLYFASQAKKDGLEYYAKIFNDTATNEKAHAKVWFKLTEGGKIKDTKENLKNCIQNEHYEHTKMYPEFAKIAKEEGFDDIAELFMQVAQIENFHYERYKKLLENLEENKVFKKNEKQTWECANCGYSTVSTEAPKICPVCKHAQSYFFVKENIM